MTYFHLVHLIHSKERLSCVKLSVCERPLLLENPSFPSVVLREAVSQMYFTVTEKYSRAGFSHALL